MLAESARLLINRGMRAPACSSAQYIAGGMGFACATGRR
jgi:hypothetical protein